MNFDLFILVEKRPGEQWIIFCQNDIWFLSIDYGNIAEHDWEKKKMLWFSGIWFSHLSFEEARINDVGFFSQM